MMEEKRRNNWFQKHNKGRTQAEKAMNILISKLHTV
jgi:hypothetical protein